MTASVQDMRIVLEFIFWGCAVTGMALLMAVISVGFALALRKPNDKK
jgi:hypothetical protein